jgi:hypothetical protein
MAAKLNTTRRGFLKYLPLPLAAAAPALACEKPLTDEEAIQYHVEALKVILTRLHPEADKVAGWYSTSTNSGSGGVFVLANVRYVKFTGPGQYEVEMPNRTCPILQVERFGEGYRACRMWKGKRETPWKRYSDLKLLSRIS